MSMVFSRGYSLSPGGRPQKQSRYSRSLFPLLYSSSSTDRSGNSFSLSLSLSYISTSLHPHIVYLCISVINDYNSRLFVIDCEPILYIYKSDRQFILNSQFERVEIQNKCIPKYQRNALFQIQI